MGHGALPTLTIPLQEAVVIFPEFVSFYVGDIL